MSERRTARTVVRTRRRPGQMSTSADTRDKCPRAPAFTGVFRLRGPRDATTSDAGRPRTNVCMRRGHLSARADGPDKCLHESRDGQMSTRPHSPAWPDAAAPGMPRPETPDTTDKCLRVPAARTNVCTRQGRDRCPRAPALTRVVGTSVAQGFHDQAPDTVDTCLRADGQDKSLRAPGGKTRWPTVPGGKEIPVDFHVVGAALAELERRQRTSATSQGHRVGRPRNLASAHGLT
jgi:hypothetical protein